MIERERGGARRLAIRTDLSKYYDMETKLTVYIDEGGDSGVKDGLRYHGTRHEWFTLGAYVVRTEQSAGLVALRDHLLREVNARQVDNLHYYKLKEDRRKQACDILSLHPARAFCFASHKTNMREHINPRLGMLEAEKFYRWCCRLLLERVMEFALNDARTKSYDVSPLEIIFSENNGLNYDAMFSYFEILTQQARLGQYTLKPKCWIPGLMDRKFWKYEPGGKLAGLQLADIVASSFLQGANNAAANHNPEPAKSLAPIIARDSRGSHRNAGVTLWPLEHQARIPTQARPLFEYYGYRF